MEYLIILIPIGLVLFAAGLIADEEWQRTWGRPLAGVGCAMMVVGGIVGAGVTG